MTPRIGPGELGGFERRLLAALTILDEQRQPTTPWVPGGVLQPVSRLRASRSHGRWTYPVLAALAGLVILAATAVAGLYNPASFQPAGDVVVAGGSTQVKGSGCAAGSKITFTLDGKTALGAGTADRGGLFSLRLPVPVEISAGPHDLAAACTNNDGKDFVQHAKLQVVKSLPPMGPSFSAAGSAVAGTSTMVKGSGCAAGGKVIFTLDGETALGATTARAGGDFFAQLPLPAGTPAGSHDLTATCPDNDGTDLVQHARLAVVKPQPGGPTPTK
jgi:hypothetical protein